MAKIHYQRPRGTHDILPADMPTWSMLRDTFRTVCEQAGYKQISTPMIESTELFVRSVGDTSEIVGKELYSFEDKSGNALSLKPESTAGVARAYIENGMSSLPKPVRLFYLEPAFRYERPQAGRYRQHHQAGVEVFGSADALIDAQVIKLVARYYDQLGIGYRLLLNTLGDKTDRVRYTKALVNYFAPYRDNLPEVNQIQLERNPLRILDSKDPDVQNLASGAPQILDYLSRDAQAHFRAVLEFLDDFGVEYEIDARLVRGLDYYTRTVFEFKGTHKGMQDTIGAGGRYDGLIADLGGSPTPAVGFGIGLERVEQELKQSERSPLPLVPLIKVISLGDASRHDATILVEKLLDSGVSVVQGSGKSLTDQLASAAKNGTPYAIIIGQKEHTKKEVILKDLVSGTQETMTQSQLLGELLRRISN